VSEPGESQEVEEGTSPDVPSDDALATNVEADLAELTADLQRLQAEYVNYRKRVERDRALARSAGEASVLRSLLTVLDDLGRADEHGELTGGFKAVADALQAAVKSHRLEAFGAQGDVFDPRLHEALFHAGESEDVETTTVDSVIRVGYRVGDDVLRHAQVGVVDPVRGDAADQPADSESVSTEPSAGESDTPAGEAAE
jgi:molecular chaperone GrpE